MTRRIGTTLAAMLILAGLSGCKPARRAGATDAAVAAQAVTAAEDAVRRSLPAAAAQMQFRGVQSYAQAIAGHRAVCGQVSPYPDDPALFVPFVAVVETGTGAVPETPFVGTSVAEADRTYMALVAECYAGGGPSDGPVHGMAPIPPLPNTVATPAPAAVGPAAGPAASPSPAAATPGADADATQPASGSAVMRQNANLHDAPHGAPVRVVPQGTALHVFATAPGGWLQVGDSAPWGWVHESMLERR